MIFSERLKLINQYRAWLRKASKECGAEVLDSHDSFLVFLIQMGYIKDMEVKKDGQL